MSLPSPSPKRPFFVFAHIPKCGGTTFIKTLKRNFGDKFYHDHGLLQNYCYTLEQTRLIVAQQSHLDCIASHRYNFDFPFTDPDCPREIKAFTFVRDPVDRAISHYFFHRLHSQISLKEIDRDVEDYFKRYAEDKKILVTYKDGQTLILGGRGGLPHIQQLAADGHVMVLPLRRFDDAMIVLETRFPNFFRDCSYSRLNQSERDQPVPEHVRELIRQFQHKDMELCRWAEESLDRELTQLFPEAERLAAKRADFLMRCELRAEKAGWRRRLLSLRLWWGRRQQTFQPPAASLLEEQLPLESGAAKPSKVPSIRKRKRLKKGDLPAAPSAGDASRVLIYAHIPKCGGKTFNSVLRRNFGETYYREEALYSGYKYTKEEIVGILQTRYTLHALSSHRLTFDLPWANSPRPILGLTFVREPIERALSSYYYLRRHPGIASPAKSQSPEEVLREKLPRLENFQAFFLGRGKPNPDFVAKLVELGWAHVFPSDRYEEAMLVLERAYPLDFRDCSYKIQNQSPRDEVEISRELRAKFEAATRLDAEIVALSNHHLDSLLTKYFPTPAALETARAELRQRNAIRASGAPENRVLSAS